MNENVSGDKYSRRHANAFLNLKVFDTFFFFSLCSFIHKFQNFLLSLCFLGVSSDVTEKIEITLKVVIYSFILVFQNISHQRNMTFTYCFQFWVDLFVSFGRISSETGGDVGVGGVIGIGWHLCLGGGLFGVSFGGALCCAIEWGQHRG